MMIPSTLDDLNRLPRWTAWINEARPGGGKLTKTPYRARGRRSQSNNPRTWITRAAAEIVARQVLNGSGGGSGIWLGALGDGLILIGIDLDRCRDPVTGEIADWRAWSL